MPVHNSDVAELFNETADLLEVKGANPFQIRAYRNAAMTVKNLSGNVGDMIKQGKDLTEYPGIGKDLAGKIKQIVETGNFDKLKDLRKEVPQELSRLMKISGLGGKRVKKIYEELDISTVDDLEQAAQKKKIRSLEGFGEKTEQSILEGIERIKQTKGRTPLNIAEEIINPLIEYLKKDKKVKDIEVAGSNRRRKETVGDVDILVTVKKGSEVMDRFVEYEDVQKVISKGETRSSVLLRSDFQVDLRVVPRVSYGAALIYFTGSKNHNIAVRKIGVKKGLKINEYGVFKDDDRVAGKTEQEVYKKIGLDFIPPELREDRGEVEAAKKGKLPKPVDIQDIRGDLHMHTKLTDGHYTLEEMINASKNLGYEYIAVSEHSKHVSVAGGIDAKQLAKRNEEIDRINEKLKDIVVLKSIEVDILEDGTLDLPDSILKELDITTCSIHYKFNLSKEKQTQRVLKAMDNPYFNILGHPTGRMINERSPYEIDMEKILKAAKEKNCIMELNAHPIRLDINDIYCKRAKEMGVKIAISTDAHSISDLRYMSYGVGQARRGWMEKNDVINTMTLKQLRKALER